MYQVVDYQHIKMGRGSAQISLKLRNLRDGHIIERGFQASEKFTKAFIEYRPVQYLYSDGDLYHFMDTENFNQLSLNEAQLGDAIKYLKEEMNLELLVHRDEPIGVEMPKAVELKVAETGPGFKGDTASAGSKPSKLETGITVNVPLFVNKGDTIKVDTRTGQYIERVG
ncbi:MAG: elongation factor P [Chloroflexota bacterium]